MNFQGIRNEMQNFVSWITPPLSETLPLSKDPETIFREKINQYANGSLSSNECIQDCVKCLLEQLSSKDCDLSEESQIILNSHTQTFNKIANDVLCEVREIEDLKCHFQDCFLEHIESKWCANFAETFYLILAIPYKKAQIKGVKKWLESFYKGANYLNIWESRGQHQLPFVNHIYLQTLILKTKHAFITAMQKKFETTCLIAEKNPRVFSDVLKKVEKKAVSAPDFLTEEEQTYYPFVFLLKNPPFSPSENFLEPDQFMPQLRFQAHAIQTRANFEKEIELLEKCLNSGYTHEIGLPWCVADLLLETNETEK
jgi:hypothetical protein